MSTEKQIEANRRNAQSSTGPKTPEGKARSSLNALKHGLTSAQVLAPSESEDEFNAHADSLRDRFAPTDSYESILVDRIIAAAWRLRRALILERFILEQQATDVKASLKKYGVHYTDPADYLALAFRKECDGKNSLETLSRHETRIDRAFYRAVHELDRQRSRPAPSTQHGGAGFSEGPEDGQPAAVAFTETRERAAAEPKAILQNEPDSPDGAGFPEGPASGQPRNRPSRARTRPALRHVG